MQYFINGSIHTKFILGMQTWKEKTKKNKNVFVTTGLTEVRGGAVIKEEYVRGAGFWGAGKVLFLGLNIPFLGFHFRVIKLACILFSCLYVIA